MIIRIIRGVPRLGVLLGSLMAAAGLLTATAVTPPGTGATAIASSEPGWPQFRGPKRDGVSSEEGLLKTWEEAGPKLLWKAEGIGRGFSSPIITRNRIFITGDIGEVLQVFALDLEGKKRWTASNGNAWTGEFPGARASVTFFKGRIYHQNAHGRLACMEAETGKTLWAVDLLQQFKGKNITWALSEAVVVDERAVYATAGGSEALMVALHPENGNVVWKSESLTDSEDGAVENASYVSPILVSFAGRRLLIGASLRNLFCVAADSGKLQWTARMPTSYSVLAMMPVLVGDAVFMTAPHGRRGQLFRLVAPSAADGKVGVDEAWNTKLDTCQGGVVHAAGKLFGSFYGPRQGWAAVDAKSGAMLYQAPELIKGAAIYGDERLYVLSENGWMHLLEPGESQFETRGKFRLVEAKNDAWAHPVIYDGRLYLRYHETLYCYDIRERAAETEGR